MNKEKVYSYLEHHCKGKENRRSAARLSFELKLGKKEIVDQVHWLRCEGKPVAYEKGGYFIAMNADDTFKTIRRLEKQCDGINKAINGLISSLAGFGANP